MGHQRLRSLLLYTSTHIETHGSSTHLHTHIFKWSVQCVLFQPPLFLSCFWHLPRWGKWVLRQGLSQTRQLKGRSVSIRAPCSKGCAFRLTTVNTPAERSNSLEAIVVSSPVLVCAPKSAN